jgi:hypothetical protein
MTGGVLEVISIGPIASHKDTDLGRRSGGVLCGVGHPGVVSLRRADDHRDGADPLGCSVDAVRGSVRRGPAVWDGSRLMTSSPFRRHRAGTARRVRRGRRVRFLGRRLPPATSPCSASPLSREGSHQAQLDLATPAHRFSSRDLCRGVGRLGRGRCAIERAWRRGSRLATGRDHPPRGVV